MQLLPRVLMNLLQFNRNKGQAPTCVLFDKLAEHKQFAATLIPAATGTGFSRDTVPFVCSLSRFCMRLIECSSTVGCVFGSCLQRGLWLSAAAIGAFAVVQWLIPRLTKEQLVGSRCAWFP